MTTGTDALHTDGDGDGDEDRTCCVKFTQDGNAIADSTADLDEVEDGDLPDVWTILTSKSAQCFVANKIFVGGRSLGGLTQAIGTQRFIMAEDTASDMIFVHEWGHAVGLNHDSSNKKLIMYAPAGAPGQPGAEGYVSETECKAYEGVQ